MNFEEQHAAYRARCNEALSAATEGYFQPMSVVSNAARYSLLDGGKRVRGVLVLAVCDLLKGDFRAADVFAAAIEMMHAFSLIHDDLPCMDNDDMRRGKPSTHVQFGEANALLAGDLLAIAPFEVIARAPYEPQVLVRAEAILAGAAGGRGMILGQELDMQYEGQADVDEASLCAVQQNKTGALFLGAVSLGAAAAKEEMETCPALAQYADNLGLAFQIADDILDVTSSQEVLGKPVGSDEKNEKATFVTVKGVDAARAQLKALTDQAALAVEQAYGEDAAFLAEFARRLAKRVN